MAQQRTPSQGTGSQQRGVATTSRVPTGKASAGSARSEGTDNEKSAAGATSPSSSSGVATGNLKNLLDELGAASDAARLQLHLLALEAKQRSGEFGAKLESV